MATSTRSEASLLLLSEELDKPLGIELCIEGRDQEPILPIMYYVLWPSTRKADSRHSRRKPLYECLPLGLIDTRGESDRG